MRPDQMTDYIAAGGALVLAALGLLIAIREYREAKRVGLLAIVGTATIITLAAAFDSISRHNTEDAVAHRQLEALTGPDNFCFLEAKISNPSDLNSPVPLVAVNKGAGPIQRLQIFISPYWVGGRAKDHPEAYYSIMPRALEMTCPAGSTPVGLALHPGRYRIEFTWLLAMRDSISWHEILTIEQSYDQLVTTADVFLSSGKVIRSQRPPGYVDW
jgi:hypothetical protein